MPHFCSPLEGTGPSEPGDKGKKEGKRKKQKVFFLKGFAIIQSSDVEILMDDTFAKINPTDEP